jgi:hypothetical protein
MGEKERERERERRTEAQMDHKAERGQTVVIKVQENGGERHTDGAGVGG